MTLAKSASTHHISLGTPVANADEQKLITLDPRLINLSTQATDKALHLWSKFQPVATDKTQATWQLLRKTQPVQLLLAAALAVLSIALVTLVTTFGGVLVLLLKMTALTLAAVAVGQWVSRGLTWADDQLLNVEELKD
ncbi:MAG: hypothetical protein AAF572_17500 [Cyanobacteria bacterium P01_B01_bin.77]